MARAIGAVKAFVEQEVVGRSQHGELDLARLEAGGDLADLNFEDGADIFALQLAEHDDFLHAVEQLRTEVLLGGFHHLLAQRGIIGGGGMLGKAQPRPLARGFGADVGGHDDDGVAEIHGAAQAIGQAAFLEDLQHHVHDIGVGLLDFVEQHDGIRTAADALGELAAFFIAHIARRGADEPRGVELFHVFRHVNLDEGVGAIEHELGERFGQQRFADAGRAEENKGTNGPARVFEVRARATQRLANRGNGVLLADDRLGQRGFHFQQLGGFLLLHFFERYASPLGDDQAHVLFVDIHNSLGVVAPPVRQLFFERGAHIAFGVAQFGGLLKLLVFDGHLALLQQVGDFALLLLDVDGAGHGADPGAGAGFINHVNGLVGEEAVLEIAGGEAHGGLDGVIAKARVVVGLVAGAQALEDFNGFLNGRLAHENALEAAFQGGIFFDELAVFVQRSGADHLEFAAGERGLEDVGRVHGALGAAGADEAMQLIHEQNHIFDAADFIHDRLDAFLELAAVFCAGHHQRQIQRDDALAEKQFRNFAVHDGLGQSFGNRRFAHAGFAQQCRIIFGAPAQDAHDALDFIGAADHRVQRALLRQCGQIASERRQRRSFLLFGATGFVGPGAEFGPRGIAGRFLIGGRRLVIRIQLLEDGIAGFFDIHVQVGQHACRHTLRLAQQAQQDVLGADVIHVHGPRLGAGQR